MINFIRGFFFVQSWNRGPGNIIVIKVAIQLLRAAAIPSHKISVNNTDLSIYQPIKRNLFIITDNFYLSIHQSVYIVELEPTFLICLNPIPPDLRPPFIIYIYMGLNDSLTVI